MAYNYAREKRRFDAEWKRKALWYRKEGMSEEDIAEMYRFDLAQFNRDRAYESRLLSVGDGLRLLLYPDAVSSRALRMDRLDKLLAVG